MKDDDFAADEVCRLQAATPAGKWARKPLVNWVEWQERYGRKTSKAKVKIGIPYEKKQYIIKRMGKFGRTAKEAEDEWNEWLASEVERDHYGFKGQVRLWIDDKEQKELRQEVFIEKVACEGSDRRKNPTAQDRDDLRKFASADRPLASHEFFSGKSTLEGFSDVLPGDSTSTKSGGSASSSSAFDLQKRGSPGKTDAIAVDLEASDNEDDEETPAKQRKLDVPKQRNKFFESAAKAFRGREDDARAQIALADAALQKAKENPATASRTDIVARIAYQDTVRVRRILACAWLGMDVDLPSESPTVAQHAEPSGGKDVQVASARRGLVVFAHAQTHSMLSLFPPRCDFHYQRSSARRCAERRMMFALWVASCRVHHVSAPWQQLASSVCL